MLMAAAYVIKLQSFDACLSHALYHLRNSTKEYVLFRMYLGRSKTEVCLYPWGALYTGLMSTRHMLLERSFK
jgi:hypothetical protein